MLVLDLNRIWWVLRPDLPGYLKKVVTSTRIISWNSSDALTPRCDATRRSIQTTLVKYLAQAVSKVNFSPVSVKLSP